VVEPVRELTITPKLAAVLRVFLEDQDRDRYGFELMRLTGQPSGTLYPILAKLESAGWIIGGHEQIDPKVEGRPPRRFYRITPVAARLAYDRLTSLSEQYRPPAWDLNQPAGEAGRPLPARSDQSAPGVPDPAPSGRPHRRSTTKPASLRHGGDALCLAG
jgi:PadR family transcriptional regulator, regulatory protein PadR